MSPLTLTPSCVEEMPEPVAYTPRTGSLTVSRGTRQERDRVAVAVTANRASKVAKLADDGLLDTAARYLADLHADIAHYLKTTRRDPDSALALHLAMAAVPPFEPAPAAELSKGDPVQIAGQLTGRVSFTYAARGSRWYAVAVTRTMEPPHPQWGERWPEQYNIRAGRLTAIADSDVIDHPYQP